MLLLSFRLTPLWTGFPVKSAGKILKTYFLEWLPFCHNLSRILGSPGAIKQHDMFGFSCPLYQLSVWASLHDSKLRAFNSVLP